MDIQEIVKGGVSLMEVEPHVYSALQGREDASYDKWGGVYEKVACNRIYNRLLWGYSITEYHRLCADALASGEGWLLDVGCGSLAFSARAYLEDTSRPVVLLDRSIRMIRSAKRRLVGLNGRVPENMAFLHADAERLPVEDASVRTVIALNLLHAVDDATEMVREIERVMAEGGSAAITTLIQNGRFADAYLHRLALGGALKERDLDQLVSIFTGLGLGGSYFTRGNLAFVSLGAQLPFFSASVSMPFGI